MNYYLGRLNMGYSKTSIIIQLASSKEADARHTIKGIDKLIAEERRANHWFWGFFIRPLRYERLMQQQIAELKRLSHHISQPAHATQTEKLIQLHLNELRHLGQLVTNNHHTAPTPESDTHSANLNLDTQPPAEPEGFNRLTPRARTIFLQLKQAAALQAGGAA
jgi:hypothetical protein